MSWSIYENNALIERGDDTTRTVTTSTGTRPPGMEYCVRLNGHTDSPSPTKAAPTTTHVR